MTVENQRMFFGGIPTEPDIRRIRDAYPDSRLKAGQCISYEVIAEITHTEIHDSRFRTVTGRWRREVERETDKVIRAGGGGFTVATEPEKIDMASGKTKSSLRARNRSATLCMRVNRALLKEEDTRRLDHTDRINAAMALAARIAAKADVPWLGASVKENGK